MPSFTAENILRLFNLLNDKLQKDDIQGELYLVGGAVMCLVHKARESTQDIDALFEPSQVIRKAARNVATEEDIAENWLNDGVKGFFSAHGNFSNYLVLSHLKILVASPEYLLAMKCLAMRIGDEFHDLEDVRYLLRYLNLEKYTDAITVISKYYPLEKFPQKTLYALEELMNNQG